MNFIFSIIYVIIMMCLYQLIGFFINKSLDKQYNFSQKITLGFVAFTSVQWLVGFPAQFFHISWNVYFLLQLSTYAIILLVIIWFLKRKKITSIQINMIDINKKIKRHMAEYWFLYLLIFSFGIFSVTSQLPYFEMNYDDHYYIGRIVQEIGASQLATENFFTGISTEVGFDRIITTYEIGYGFWSQVFQIEPVFFARFTMTFFNYLVTFFAIHAAMTPLFKKKELTQFILILFPILILPAGYLWDLQLFKPFDGWQLNTAMWYGGSIVRMAGIPILFFAAQLFLENKIFGMIVGVLAAIALIANSAIAITMIFVVGLCLLVAWLLTVIFSRKTKWSIRILSAGSILIIAIGFIIMLKIIPQFPIDFYDKILNAQSSFNIDNNIRMGEGKLLLVFGVGFVLSIVFARKKTFWLYWLTLVGSTLLLLVPQFQPATMSTTWGYFFVASRVWTAVQYMFVIFTGYVIVSSFSKIRYVVGACALIILIIVLGFNISNLEKYKQLSFTPSGLSSAGYSVKRLVENEHMMPEVIHDFGEYFDEQKEKQQVISAHFVNYEQHILHLNAGMIMSSNNIELCNSTYATCENMTNEQKKLLDLFANQMLDSAQMQEVLQIINTYKLDQLIVQNKDVVDTLINKYGGQELVKFEDEYGNAIYLIDITQLKNGE